MFYRKSALRCTVLAALGLCLCFALGCHRADVHQALAANHFIGGSAEPTMLAAYQPWFGRPGHINPGYTSQDQVVLEKQVDKAKQLGISGFVVNWYGPRHPFEDKAYTVLQQVAAEKNFKTAIMYDEDDSDPSNSTDSVLVDLQYAYDRYVGPHAMVNRESYLTYQGRPVILVFPKSGRTDWNRVRQALNSWENPPLLIMKDINTRWASDFDGFYAWVSPGTDGWRPDGSNWGQQYLDDFYHRMLSQYPNKIAVGAAWPGFNDSQASWSRNRKMNSRCGKTLDDTLRTFRKYYTQDHPLPFLMIETWNDYEEGTAIENGVNTCK